MDDHRNHHALASLWPVALLAVLGLLKFWVDRPAPGVADPGVPRAAPARPALLPPSRLPERPPAVAGTKETVVVREVRVVRTPPGVQAARPEARRQERNDGPTVTIRPADAQEPAGSPVPPVPADGALPPPEGVPAAPEAAESVRETVPETKPPVADPSEDLPFPQPAPETIAAAVETREKHSRPARFSSGTTHEGVPFTSFDIIQKDLRLPITNSLLGRGAIGAFVQGRDLRSLDGGPYASVGNHFWVGVGLKMRSSFEHRKPDPVLMMGARWRF